MNMKLQFTLAEQPVHRPTHRIMDLCDYLTAEVLQPMLKRNGVKWDSRFMDFFSFDNTCNPLDPTGAIRLAVPPLLAGQIGCLEQAIVQELSRLKIKTGPFQYERDPVHSTVQAMTIPITDNPTALAAAPEVNMSYMRGYLVLRDLLGYERVDGRYEFSAEDLLKRLSSVTEDKIAACTASPVRDPEMRGEVRRKPSPVSMKAIKRCLDEIKQFAQWAVSHHYRKVAAA